MFIGTLEIKNVVEQREKIYFCDVCTTCTIETWMLKASVLKPMLAPVQWLLRWGGYFSRSCIIACNNWNFKGAEHAQILLKSMEANAFTLMMKLVGFEFLILGTKHWTVLAVSIVGIRVISSSVFITKKAVKLPSTGLCFFSGSILFILMLLQLF